MVKNIRKYGKYRHEYLFVVTYEDNDNNIIQEFIDEPADLEDFPDDALVSLYKFQAFENIKVVIDLYNSVFFDEESFIDKG